MLSTVKVDQDRNCALFQIPRLPYNLVVVRCFYNDHCWILFCPSVLASVSTGTTLQPRQSAHHEYHADISSQTLTSWFKHKLICGTKNLLYVHTYPSISHQKFLCILSCIAFFCHDFRNFCSHRYLNRSQLDSGNQLRQIRYCHTFTIDK